MQNLEKILGKGFVLFLLAVMIYACFRIFEPFLIEIVVAAILTSIFYRPYKWLSNHLGGSKRIASFITCFMVVLLVIIPAMNLIVLAAQESIRAYQGVVEFFDNSGLDQGFTGELIDWGEEVLGIDGENILGFVVEGAKRFSNVLVDGAAWFTKGTLNFIFSLIAIIFAMFFFFIDGDRLAKKLMSWTPLPKKYDQELFTKFREVSYSTVLATFATAFAQGLAAGIGFVIVGVPAFFLSIITAFLTLIPYLGSFLVWGPVGAYLLLTGNIWQGVFILVYGALIINFIDNIVRAYVIRGKSQAHPLFIIFSILGGIVAFGFWGVIIGPLVISLALTILHIYELEFSDLLTRN